MRRRHWRCAKADAPTRMGVYIVARKVDGRPMTCSLSWDDGWEGTDVEPYAWMELPDPPPDSPVAKPKKPSILRLREGLDRPPVDIPKSMQLSIYRTLLALIRRETR